MSDSSVVRYVVTHIGKDGIRTLADPRQGRFTYTTQEEAQARIGALMANNSGEKLSSIFGLPLEVREVECWPGHHDPKTCWFE